MAAAADNLYPRPEGASLLMAQCSSHIVQDPGGGTRLRFLKHGAQSAQKNVHAHYVVSCPESGSR